MKRKTQSFIAAFEDFHKDMEVPKIFVTWTALWVMSALLERRVWTYTKRSRLFPNLYVYLVGIAGLGKSDALKNANLLIRNVEPTLIGPDSITGAFLADAIRDGERKIIDPKTQQVEIYHSTNFLTSDLQTMLSVWDDSIVAKLTRLYDCDDYGEGRRGGKGENTFYCPKVCITMLAGTTPSFLRDSMPATIWGHGYMSRTILVFSGETVRDSLFSSEEEALATKEMEVLMHEAKAIRQIYNGPFSFTEGAKVLVDKFWRYPGLQGGPPIPTDARLQSYATRRPSHLLKLMQLFCIDDASNTMLLTEDHYHRAYEFLIANEVEMPKALHGQRGSSAQAVVDQFLDWLIQASIHYDQYGLEGAVPLSKAKEFLRTNMTEMEAFNILRGLESDGTISQSTDKKKGGKIVKMLKDPRRWEDGMAKV